MTHLTDRQAQALKVWTNCPDWVLPFATVSARSGIPSHQTRSVIRALARKGMVEIGTGFTEMALSRGRGYMPTAAGRAMLQGGSK